MHSWYLKFSLQIKNRLRACVIALTTTTITLSYDIKSHFLCIQIPMLRYVQNRRIQRNKKTFYRLLLLKFARDIANIMFFCISFLQRFSTILIISSPIVFMLQQVTTTSMQPFSDEYLLAFTIALFNIKGYFLYSNSKHGIYYTHNADYFLILTSTRRELLIAPFRPLGWSLLKADEFYWRKTGEFEFHFGFMPMPLVVVITKKIIVSVKLANLRMRNRSFRFAIVVGHLKERNKWFSGAVKSGALPQFTA